MTKEIDVVDALRNAWLFIRDAQLSAECWENYIGVDEMSDGAYQVRRVARDNTLLPGPALAIMGTPESARILVMAARQPGRGTALPRLLGMLRAQDARTLMKPPPPPPSPTVPVTTKSGAVVEIDRKAVISFLRARPQIGDMKLEFQPDGTLRAMVTVEGLDVRRFLAKPREATEAELEFTARWRRIVAAQNDVKMHSSYLRGGWILQDPANGEWVGCVAEGAGKDRHLARVTTATDHETAFREWSKARAAAHDRQVQYRRDAAKRSYEAKKARRGY